MPTNKYSTIGSRAIYVLIRALLTFCGSLEPFSEDLDEDKLMPVPEGVFSDYDFLYWTWEALIDIEYIEPFLVKLVAKQERIKDSSSSKLFTLAAISIVATIAASIIYIIGPSELHVPTLLLFTFFAWYVIKQTPSQQI